MVWDTALFIHTFFTKAKEKTFWLLSVGDTVSSKMVGKEVKEATHNTIMFQIAHTNGE